MSLSSLSTAQLRQLIQLVKEKETLQAKLAQVNRSLETFPSDEENKAPLLPKKRIARRGRRRVKLKDALLEMLQAAGKDGVTFKELSAKLKTSYNSISTWFHTTGKKTKGIKKIGPAKYAYNSE